MVNQSVTTWVLFPSSLGGRPCYGMKGIQVIKTHKLKVDLGQKDWIKIVRETVSCPCPDLCPNLNLLLKGKN